MILVPRILDATWRSHYRGRYHEEMPDVIGLDDVAQFWPSLYNSLISDINKGNTRIENIEIIDLPKDAISVRPLVRFSIRDRILYEALVFAVAGAIEKHLFNSVFSYRWNRLGFSFKGPVGMWLNMQRAARKNLADNPGDYAARTDVTSFYENIHLETLIDDIEAASGERNWVQLLHTYLDSFQSFHSAWGLPQGSDASGILANLYLLPVDELLRRRGILTFRYSDDMYLFGPDFWQLRDALLQINDVLRSRRLSMATHKTTIMTPAQAKDFFDDAEKDAIQYGIQVGNPGSRQAVRSYFDEVIESEAPSARDLRFAINRLKRLEDDYALTWVLDRSAAFPHLSRDFFPYIASFLETRGDEIKKRLAVIVCDGSIRPYPYLQFQVIRMALKHSILDPNILDAAWEILEDRNRGSLPREFAVRYIARSGSLSSGMLMKHQFENEPDIPMRRALMVGMYESGYFPKRIFSSLSGSDQILAMTARYLDSGPSVPVL